MARTLRPRLRDQPHPLPDLTDSFLRCRTMREAYSQEVLDELLAQVPSRQGWDFSRMNVLRQPVPWN